MKAILLLVAALLFAPLTVLHAAEPATPFPARVPLTKPTDRPLSAAMQRLYDVWNPHKDRGDQLYSLYYKGQPRTPIDKDMLIRAQGVATADLPEGPFEKSRTLTALTAALLLAPLATDAQAADKPDETSKAFYTPKQDLDGLKPNADVKAGLPNVLLIGDSISIGYTKPAIDRLKDVANVQRAKANCGDTTMGLKNLNRWLGETKWDVIHFNWGLWDLCYRHPDSKVYGHRDKIKGTIAVPLDQYEENLEQLVRQLEKTGATLIWASTTRVPDGEAGRFAGDEIKYNAVAVKIMAKHGIAIDDLHALTATFPPELSSSPGDVHYAKAGYQKLAEQVAKSIKTYGLAKTQKKKGTR